MPDRLVRWLRPSTCGGKERVAGVIEVATEAEQAACVAGLDYVWTDELPTGGAAVLVFGGSGPAGPQGEPGPAGAAGPEGPPGATGPAGPVGLTGPEGPAGPTGATGPAGPVGLTGPQGIQGLTGDTGPQGLTGAQGPQGLPGATGATGAQGPQGLPGDTGPAGATGPQGLPGDTGPAGATGPQGLPGDTGPQGLPGDTGPAGATGPQGLPGDTGPAGATGADGADALTTQPYAATGVLGSSIARNGHVIATLSVLATGKLSAVAVRLKAGDVVSSITWVSGTTAMATPVNWWFALYDGAGDLLRQTADQMTAAWPAQTPKRLDLTAPVTITTTGTYYLAIMVNALTVPTLVGANTQPALTGGAEMEPTISGNRAGAGLTTTAPTSLGTLNPVGSLPYADARST